MLRGLNNLVNTPSAVSDLQIKQCFSSCPNIYLTFFSCAIPDLIDTKLKCRKHNSFLDFNYCPRLFTLISVMISPILPIHFLFLGHSIFPHQWAMFLTKTHAADMATESRPLVMCFTTSDHRESHM